MKNYHKIKLQELLQYIDPLNTSFMDNQQIISMEMIKEHLNNPVLFIDNDENRIAQQVFEHETLFWLKKIIFQIHNTQFLHDGNIKLHIYDNAPYLDNASVIYGMEKIIGAIYHGEEFIIVQTIGSLPHTFSGIESYDAINDIDYGFTHLPIPQESKDIIPNINCGEHIDLHYVSAKLSKNMVIDWHDKDMIMRKVQASNKNNALDNIKNNMPEKLLQDVDFIVQLIFTNFYVAYWFDEYEPMTFAICEKLYDINTEKSIDTLIQLLTYYWSEHYSECYSEGYYSDDRETKRFSKKKLSNSYNLEKIEALNKYLLSNEKLVHFMLTNEEFDKASKVFNIDIVGVLPIHMLHNKKLLPDIVNYCRVDVLPNLPHEVYNNKEYIIKLFNCFMKGCHYTSQIKEFKNFIKNNEYAHIYWYDSKDILLDILHNLDKSYQTHKSLAIQHIYQCLSPKLQNDNEVIIAFLSVADDMIATLPHEKKHDPVIMHWYMTYGELRNTHFSYTQDKKIYSYQDFYKQTDDKTIQHICKELPDILWQEDAPDAWKNNFELATYNSQYFANNFTKYSTSVRDKIINDEQLLKEWIQKHYEIYEGLPLHLQENEELALIYAKKDPYKPNYPMKLLLSMEFCYSLTEIDVHNIKYVPSIIKNNIYFTICFFGILFNGKHYSSTIDSMKPYYEELFALFEHFNIDDYYTFLLEHFQQQNTYQLHQDLQKLLPVNDKKTGKTKI